MGERPLFVRQQGRDAQVLVRLYSQGLLSRGGPARQAVLENLQDGHRALGVHDRGFQIDPVVQRVLEAAGVEFLVEDDSRPGVRLRKSDKGEAK